ncbi:hypothetical protein RBU49_01665 [Clostridium sp. MB40-C1]|uniref:hypothetical protein n=1 Tax=Clostridium sp. MB40-C1 TaxID=3070996 RepID=UPI0027DF030C|nr:hypothetical protein [Clostridium sp. MB40-C1]WMJ80986.1 hypothetical protein RBU49_01665 [Clostridium sp. MB40-C1]
MYLFQDNFNSKILDTSKWYINTLNGYNVSIEENRLKFCATGKWCGAYAQPKTLLDINTFKKLMIEFDYTMASNHYGSADKPYIAFLNPNIPPVRDGRYNMIQPDGKNQFLIYLANNMDSTSRTKFSMSNNPVDGYSNNALKAASVNYKTGTTLHIKLVLDSKKKDISMYIDNNESPLINCVIPNWDTMGEQWEFEINSNSYSSFIEYYDNFTIYCLIKDRYLIKQNTNYYSINSNLSTIGQPSDNIQLKTWFDKHGVDDINILTENLSIKETPMTKDEATEIWKTDFKLDFNDITENIELIDTDENNKSIKYDCNNYRILDLLQDKFDIMMLK